MEARVTELVARARRGDKDAFGELMQSAYQPAEHLASRMVGSRELARDLVQEAVLTAWLSLANLRNDSSFASWLYGIVLNLCRSHLRRRTQEALALEHFSGGQWYPDCRLVGSPPTPEEIAEAAELQRLVRSALELLPPRTRRAAALVYLEGLALRETAALMRISVGTVKAHLHKARGELRESLLAAVDAAVPPAKGVPMARVNIWDIVETPTGAYTVVLEDPAARRWLPVTIGAAEGQALVRGLRNISLPRPLTYSLVATGHYCVRTRSRVDRRAHREAGGLLILRRHGAEPGRCSEGAGLPTQRCDVPGRTGRDADLCG